MHSTITTLIGPNDRRAYARTYGAVPTAKSAVGVAAVLTMQTRSLRLLVTKLLPYMIAQLSSTTAKLVSAHVRK